MDALRDHWEGDIRADALEKINTYAFLKPFMKSIIETFSKRPTTNWKNNFATYAKGPIFLLNEGFLQNDKKSLLYNLKCKLNRLKRDLPFLTNQTNKIQKDWS